MSRTDRAPKSDLAGRWAFPDRVFFACGACHILAFAFLEAYPAAGFAPVWIKPREGFTGNHIVVTRGPLAFDYHGYARWERLLARTRTKARRRWPGWDAGIIALPPDVLVSEAKSRQYPGLWLREPKQLLHDTLPRARVPGALSTTAGRAPGEREATCRLDSQRRVVSLIASATEIVCALGRREWLVGRSHECDFPADVLDLPALTAPKFKVEGTSAEIDARVQQIVREGLSVYRVDGEALRALAPDVIVTQDHCEVCAVSLSDVEAATCTWTGKPVDIVSLKPDSTADVYADIRRVAHGLAAETAGEALVADMQGRIAAVSAAAAGRARPRVAFIEWVEPLMAGGNWMPELIVAAGGENLFGAAGKHSDWMQWDEILAADPDVIIVAPCGYGLERCLEELPLLQAKPGWDKLKSVRAGRVYFADGNAYFNRPGPRLADSAEMLAEMLHPGATRPRRAAKTWMSPLARR